MVRYRRNFVPAGTYFFTVTLADRRSNALVDHIGTLRSAFRAARHARPFAIDAIVILPDHLHAILTLPQTMRISRATGGESKGISAAH
jgi:putative transposase